MIRLITLLMCYLHMKCHLTRLSSQSKWGYSHCNQEIHLVRNHNCHIKSNKLRVCECMFCVHEKCLVFCLRKSESVTITNVIVILLNQSISKTVVSVYNSMFIPNILYIFFFVFISISVFFYSGREYLRVNLLLLRLNTPSN